jgi:hypothetical protein
MRIAEAYELVRQRLEALDAGPDSPLRALEESDVRLLLSGFEIDLDELRMIIDTIEGEAPRISAAAMRSALDEDRDLKGLPGVWVLGLLTGLTAARRADEART